MEAGEYECAAQLEAFFYRTLRTQMNAALSQHDRRWAEYDVHSARVDLPTILTTAQAQLNAWTVRHVDCNTGGGCARSYCAFEHEVRSGINRDTDDRNRQLSENMGSTLTSVLEVESDLTRRRNEVRADALRLIEQTNAIVDAWLAGDAPEACGMLPR